MKKKGKVIITSLTSIVLSAALIAGSTFALFTSESETNIAITSGNVDIQASVTQVSAYSAKWEGGEYVDDPITGDSKTSGTFANGGTYTYDSEAKSLTLDRVSPGDGVNIQIDVTNTSSISIKYQTVVTFVSGGSVDPVVSDEDEAALFKALNITVEGEDGMENISSDRLTAVSKWSSPVNPKTNFGPINVNIKLPMETGDALQAMQCEMLISVYAVQSNGHDETNQNVYLTNSDNIADVFEELQDGDVVLLNENVEYEDFLSVEGVEATLDLGGNDLTLGVNGELVADMGASLTLTGGKITVGEENRDQEKDNFIVAYNNEGSTTTLNIDCEVDLDNVHEEPGRGYFGIWAEANTSPEEGGTPGSKAVINITDKANIHRTVADGAAVAVGANAEVNMTGGTIEVTPSANSKNTSNVASAVWLDEAGAVFNLSGGEINARGYNVAVINMWQSGTKFSMTGGKITLNVDVSSNLTGAPCSSAVEVDGDVEFSGGTIEIKSNIQNEKALACAFLAGTSGMGHVTFGEGATIIVNKAGVEGGSDRNFSFVHYTNKIPYFDETGTEVRTPESGTPGYEPLPEGWEYQGAIELVR